MYRKEVNKMFHQYGFKLTVYLILLHTSGLYSQNLPDPDDLFLSPPETQGSEESPKEQGKVRWNFHGFAGSEIIAADAKNTMDHNQKFTGKQSALSQNGIVRSELNARIDIKAESEYFRFVSLTDFFLEPDRDDLQSSRTMPVDPLEFYLSGNGNSHIWKIGHFRSGWGTADLFRTANFPDSMDLRDFLVTDRSRLYRGSPGVSLKIFSDDFFAEAVAQPWHIPDAMAPEGSYFDPQFPAKDYLYVNTAEIWKPDFQKTADTFLPAGLQETERWLIHEYLYNQYLPEYVPFASGIKIPECRQILTEQEVRRQAYEKDPLKNPPPAFTVNREGPVYLSCDTAPETVRPKAFRQNPSNASGGLRAGGKTGSLDWSLMAFAGPSKTAYSGLSFHDDKTVLKQLRIDHTMGYTYEHKAGFDFAWAWSRGTIRGEASWTADKRGMYVTGTGRSESREGPYAAYTVGADISHRNGKGRWIAEWSDGQFQTPGFIQDSFSDVLTLGTDQEFFSGKLRTSVLFIVRPVSSYPGWILMPSVTLTIAEHYSAEAGIWYTESRKDPVLELYKDKNTVFFRIKYIF